MDLTTLVNILNANGIDPKASVALNVYNQLTQFIPAAVQLPVNDYALIELRAKLTGTTIHEQLVQVALKNFMVMTNVRESKKIQAIKELRTATSCGLKEAKDAVEDSRVWGSYYHPSSY